ncbi:hypothetical protein CGK74_15505 [Thauera propionica]|jgi:hypothetical protein|uniref:Uncharacterized protein n=1 Tax=Thauera propionica TaxID=2019431 RepID=A0A235EV73_9RHOO|nr:hypothetical protein CGK74_15505 [Thauera propionica]
MRQTCFNTALTALPRLYEFLMALSSKLVAAWADRALRARMSSAPAPHSPFSKGIFPDVEMLEPE